MPCLLNFHWHKTICFEELTCSEIWIRKSLYPTGSLSWEHSSEESFILIDRSISAASVTQSLSVHVFKHWEPASSFYLVCVHHNSWSSFLLPTESCIPYSIWLMKKETRPVLALMLHIKSIPYPCHKHACARHVPREYTSSPERNFPSLSPIAYIT